MLCHNSDSLHQNFTDTNKGNVIGKGAWWVLCFTVETVPFSNYVVFHECLRDQLLRKFSSWGLWRLCEESQKNRAGDDGKIRDGLLSSI